MRSETFFFRPRRRSCWALIPARRVRPCAMVDAIRVPPEDEKRVKDALAAYLGGAGKSWEVDTGCVTSRREVALVPRARCRAADEKGQPYVWRFDGRHHLSQECRGRARSTRGQCGRRRSWRPSAPGGRDRARLQNVSRRSWATVKWRRRTRRGTPLRRNIDAAISAACVQKRWSNAFWLLAARASRRVCRYRAVDRRDTLDLIAIQCRTVCASAGSFSRQAPCLETRRKSPGRFEPLHNAMQAMNSEGTLAVALDEVEIDGGVCVSTVSWQAKIRRLSVRDTGVGIAPHCSK